jgi:hypothetical protein
MFGGYWLFQFSPNFAITNAPPRIPKTSEINCQIVGN